MAKAERKKKTITEKRDMVRRLFRSYGADPNADPTLSSKPGHSASRDKKRSNKAVEADKNDEMLPTVFENVKNSKPAICKEKAAKLNWKNGAPPPEEIKSEGETKTDGRETATEKDEKNTSDSQRHTVFEKIGAEVRPAVVIDKAYKLNWKNKPNAPDPKENNGPAEPTLKTGENTHDSAKENSEGQTGADDALPALVAKEEGKPDKLKDALKDDNFMIACKLMLQIRQCNILEAILLNSESDILKKFFEDQMENPTPEIISLLHKAMELCYDRIVYHGDEYDIYLDADSYTFIKNKELAKSKCLDVLMTVPDFLPLRWGGKSVGLKMCEDYETAGQIVTQANKAVQISKSKMMAPTEVKPESPWTPMLAETAEKENAAKENVGKESPSVPEEKGNFEVNKSNEKGKKPRKRRVLNVEDIETKEEKREEMLREERDRLIAEKKEAEKPLPKIIAPHPVTTKPLMPPGVVIQPAPQTGPRKGQSMAAQATTVSRRGTPQEQEAQKKKLTNYFRGGAKEQPKKK